MFLFNSKIRYPKAFFISLKWKIVISISVILIVINFLILFINYSSLESQFNNQQASLLAKHIRENNKQLEQTYQRLEDFVEILPFFSSSNGKQKSINQTLNEYWGRLQILFELRGATLINEKGLISGQWGEDIELSLQNLYKTVIEQQQPITEMYCSHVCNFIVAAPILGISGEIKVLIISQSVADWLLKLKNAIGADTGVISVNNANNLVSPIIDKDKFLVGWQSRVIGLTNADINLRYLEELSHQISLIDAINQNNYLRKHGKDLNIQFLNLDNENSKKSSYLLLINDITANKDQVRNGVFKSILVAAVGVFIAGLFIILAMLRPINRLSMLSKILPLLAHGDFYNAKVKLTAKEKKVFFKDELDTLNDTAMSLTNQLERLESEVKIREKKLIKNALYDELTSLPNRRLFMDRIDMALSESNRNNTKFAVLFLDLDHFKRVNDSLGHGEGDKLLLEVSNRLKLCIRESDTVARIGGDEFTILIQNIKDNNTAKDIAINILNSLREPVILNRKDIIVTSSIGISISPDNGVEAESILRHADLAMYKAKASGRNSYHYYTESMNTEAQELITLENELRIAIEQQQFELYYQPQIDLAKGTLIAVEALLRWNCPSRGLVTPDSFIPTLEATGMIVPLGEKIIRNACKQAKQWSALKIKNFRIAVNLSARQFKDANLVPFIAKTLQEFDLDSSLLELELTESMLMDDILSAIEKLHEFKQLGLSLSIDDFGTGYSSLNYIKQFPVDVLKIDQTFVKDIPNNSSDMAITSAVIAMAHKLNLKVIAEGIEEREQLEFLHVNGCDIGQGYLFGKPQPADEITELVLNKTNFMLKIASV
jgi:diguanylate cyclase (GGDEF)-like protein